MSLANLYRPHKLDEVIGQPFTCFTLQRAFDNKEFAGAYLFIGIGGTSKTTISRIIAKEVNGFTIEIDAASNNSADDVRELLARAQVKPIGKDKTVIILDECQNYSSSAWSCLLKSIEQPPKHLMFILCTTEGDKVPQTIKSRCQTFYINPVSDVDIAGKLGFICQQEDIKYEFDALIAIGKYAKGSVRMAISYLEQLSQEPVTLTNVSTNLIKASIDSFLDIIYGVTDNDFEAIVVAVKKSENAEKLCQELFTFILDISICIHTGKAELTSIHPLIIKEIDDNFGSAEYKSIDKMLKMLYDLQYKIKKSSTAREELIAGLILIMEDK